MIPPGALRRTGSPKQRLLRAAQPLMPAKLVVANVPASLETMRGPMRREIQTLIYQISARRAVPSIEYLQYRIQEASVAQIS